MTRQLDDHVVPKLRPLDLINKQQHLEKPRDKRVICAHTCAWKRCLDAQEQSKVSLMNRSSRGVKHGLFTLECCPVNMHVTI